MSRDEIIIGLRRINEYEIFDINTNTMLLLGRLKGFERKRHLCVCGMIHHLYVTTFIS